MSWTNQTKADDSWTKQSDVSSTWSIDGTYDTNIIYDSDNTYDGTLPINWTKVPDAT